MVLHASVTRTRVVLAVSLVVYRRIVGELAVAC
jgi:hypothetical protein